MGNVYREMKDTTGLPEPPLEGMIPMERAKPPKPRSRGRANAPQIRPAITDENREIIKQFLRESFVAYKMPKVKSDEELLDRISDYFNTCIDDGQFPVWEELAMYAGYSSTAFSEILRGNLAGFSENTKHIIANAKNYLASFDAKMAAMGKMNFLTYCFRAKNFYGMVDKQEHILTPNTPLGSATSADEIAAKYQELPPGE